MMDELLKKTLGSEVVRYYPGLASLCGGATTALLLSQLLYWHFNPRMKEKLSDKEGWFYISMDELKEQTGLTRREQITARRNLVDLGILEISYKGRSPRTTHYRLIIEKLNEHVSQSSQNVRTSAHVLCGLVSTKRAHFNTDTTDTTETTVPRNKTRGEANSGTSLLPLVTALVEVTGVDLDLNRSKLFGFAKRLSKSNITPDRIRSDYGPDGTWYRADWRGQKGQKPTPEQVMATWGALQEKGINTGAYNV